MIVPRHWVCERQEFPYGDTTGSVGCWGWSETDVGQARERSIAAGKRLADWLAAISRGEEPTDDMGFQGWYGYDARPAREEIVEEFSDAAGETTAFVSRNRYGCLVLNSRDLVFVDADIPPASRGDGSLVGILKGLFGMAPTKDGTQAADPEVTLFERIHAWSAEHPDIAMRLYRTAAGFRGLITNRAIDASTPEADSLLGGLPTDPLYRRLCKSQECYRARLTPKPWRVGCKAPVALFPWRDSGAEQAFERWLSRYQQAADGYATCRFVTQLGPDETLPELEPLIKLHDGACRVGQSDRLA